MANVYFTREITPESVVRLYQKLGITLMGKVAVKVHSGEKGNQNFLRPAFWKPMVEQVQGTIVECNTAYGDAFGGVRDHTDPHRRLLKEHGWSELFDVDLMDAEGPDVIWPVENGKILKENHLGKHIEQYDSMLVLAHFKGHPMGGYGGALKQLSKAMADAASTVVRHFAGRIAFINVMKNLSVDCDCCTVAEDPCMEDIGVLASLDPVALDQACIDLIYQSNDPGRDHFVERVESRNGIHTIEAADALGFGSRAYTLIEVE